MRIICSFFIFLTISGCGKHDVPPPPAPDLSFHIEVDNVHGACVVSDAAKRDTEKAKAEAAVKLSE